MNISETADSSSQANGTTTTFFTEDENSTKICDIPLGSFHIFLILINVVHLLILHKLRQQQGEKTVALVILILISTNDVLVSCVLVLKYCCITFDTCIDEILKQLGFTLATARYLVLAAACYDRFMAICKPYSYADNHFLKYITQYVTLLTICMYVVVQPLGLAEKQCWCFSAHENTQEAAVAVTGFRVATVMILSASIIISTVFVLRELQLMKKRQNNIVTPDPSILKATHLVLVTTLVFFCCLIPPAIVELYFESKDLFSLKRMRMRILFDSYAVQNVIVHGVMSKPYREIVISCYKRSNRVVPQPWSKS